MTMKLYGSLTSVYVRRIRMALEGFDYTLELVNIYDDKERTEFTKLTPIRRLPILIDGEQAIWDSHTIYHYLCDKQGEGHLTLDQHNLISVIDAVTDSMILLFQCKTSNLDTSAGPLFYNLQHGRIEESFAWLEQQAADGHFDDWHYPTMCMFSTAAWAQFRHINDMSSYPALQAMLMRHGDRDIVTLTQPKV